MKQPKYLLVKADGLWYNYIHAHYKSCLIGGDCEGWLEAHHLIGKGNKATRHARENGVLLCTKHHRLSGSLSAHNNPKAFADWMRAHQPHRWEWVRAHRWDMGTPDYREVIKSYEN